jgi:hypothetical protein
MSTINQANTLAKDTGLPYLPPEIILHCDKFFTKYGLEAFREATGGVLTERQSFLASLAKADTVVPSSAIEVEPVEEPAEEFPEDYYSEPATYPGQEEDEADEAAWYRYDKWAEKDTFYNDNNDYDDDGGWPD